MTSVLMISGSLRAASTNSALLRAAIALAPPGWTGELYDQMALLPHFNPDDDREPAPAVVAELRARIAAADALLFSTPEYAGALPGTFKNLLDWTVGGNEIGDKPVAWINVSTWPTGAAETHASLRRVLDYTGADVVESACAHIPVLRQEIDESGAIVSPSIRQAVSDVFIALDAHLVGVCQHI